MPHHVDGGGKCGGWDAVAGTSGTYRRLQVSLIAEEIPLVAISPWLQRYRLQDFYHRNPGLRILQAAASATGFGFRRDSV
jgi:hypothetical protein